MTHALLVAIYASIGYITAAAAVKIALVVAAGWHIVTARRSGPGRPLSPAAPPVSVIVVVSEDAPILTETLDALVTQEFPSFELILVSNGPIGPRTVQAIARFHAAPIDLIYRPMIPTARVTAWYHGSITPPLTVLEKERGTRADAWNAGINAARSPYVCLLEPETRLAPGALARMMAAVLDDPERVMAVSGVERITPDSTGERRDAGGVWGRLDRCGEMLAAAGWSACFGLAAIPLACVLLQKQAVLRVGGFRAVERLEWTDLFLRCRQAAGAQRRPSRLVAIPEPLFAVPPAGQPGGASHGVRERMYGRIWCALRHLSVAGRSTFKETGLSWIAVGWGLAVFAPIVELGGAAAVTAGAYWGAVDGGTLLWFWIAFWAVRSGYLCGAVLLYDRLIERTSAWRDLAALFFAAWWEPVAMRPRAAWWSLGASIRGCVSVLTAARDHVASERRFA